MTWNRSIQHSKRCAVSTWEPQRLLRFPRVLPDPSSVKQDITRTSAFSNLNNTMLANPAMLYQGFEYASSQTSVWDVQVVINFIKSQMESTDILSEKKLSLKLCMVLAFTTSSKASSLYDFDIIYYMVNTGNKVTFYFRKLQKSWEKGVATPWLTVYNYNAVELCFAKTLNKHLGITKRRREGKHSFY